MKTIIETEQFNRTLKRMTHEIIERNDDLTKLVLVGIEKKGTPIAYELQKLINEIEGVLIPVEIIDIGSHRDDNKKLDGVIVKFNQDIEEKIVVLVDDVLYTGRSVRAAMDAVMDTC